MDALSTILADHDGVITLAQARACGLSTKAIATLVRKQQWYRVARGVFLSAQHHMTDAARLRIAVATHHAVADRTAAAYWHGLLSDLPAVVTLSAPRSVHGTASCPVAIDVVRRDLPDTEVEYLRGIPVTRTPLTVLGALAELDDPPSFLDRTLQTGAVTMEALNRTFDEISTLRGLRPARELLGALNADSQSSAERDWVSLLNLHQITGWVQQYPFGRWSLDFAWPELKVAVEIQGWAYHRDTERFQSDSAKAATLAAAGWLELPFTWHQITGDPELCIAQLCSALNQRIG